MGCQAMQGVLLLGLLLASVMNVAAQTLDCSQYLSDLSGCEAFLTNGGPPNPSKACCSGIATVQNDSLSCLCSIISQFSSATTYNLTKAYEIPKDCNLTFNNASCSGASPTASSPTSGASPSPESGAGAHANPGAGSTVAPSLFTVFGAMALGCMSFFVVAVDYGLTAV